RALLALGSALRGQAVHAPLAQAHEPEQPHGRRTGSREGSRRYQVAARELRIGGQAVDLGLVHQEVEGIEPAEDRLVAVDVGIGLPRFMELPPPLLSALAQFRDRPELDRLGRTGLGPSGGHPRLHPVVAERALHRRPGDRVDIGHPERAGADPGRAPVADVRLEHRGVELGADHRAGRADLEAAGLATVLADVAHHQPAALRAVLIELLDEPDVAPGGATQPPCVVIALTAEGVGPSGLGGKLVPLLAGDLAGPAANADGGVGEESHWLSHHAFSTLQTNALASWIDTFGSPTSAERSFVTSPVTIP